MSSVAFPARGGVAVYDLPDPSRYQNVSAPGACAFFSFPAAIVGDMVLTLTNVVIGSAYRVEVQSTGALVASGTAGASSFALTIPVGVTGDPANTLLVRIRKGTAAPYYKDYETIVTAVVGSQSVYIAQIPD